MGRGQVSGIFQGEQIPSLLLYCLTRKEDKHNKFDRSELPPVKYGDVNQAENRLLAFSSASSHSKCSTLQSSDSRLWIVESRGGSTLFITFRINAKVTQNASS